METEQQTAVHDRVAALVAPLVADLGLELFEIQFRREGHGWILRLIIDSQAGVTVDNCARVSREAGNLLEIEDVIGHAYHLEVSSPGLDRPLRNEQDFQRFSGRLAKIKTCRPLDGRQVFVGRLGPLQDGVLTLACEQGEVRIPMVEIAGARLEIEF
ncbi:MAG: ribosome maturation factor RimP [Desulfobacterales bacterium]|nr:ribosome maturation factor RimP [Desulfobacterales bacterium]